MATTLKNTSVGINVIGGTVQTIGVAQVPATINEDYGMVLTNGTTGATKACRICTINSSTDGTGVTYDFTAMTGSTDGDADINFSSINYVAVINTSTTNTLRVGNSSTNFFAGCFYDGTSSITVPVATSATDPAVAVLLKSSTGIACNSGSKLLKIVASAAATTYKLIVIGIGA